MNMKTNTQKKLWKRKNKTNTEPKQHYKIVCATNIICSGSAILFWFCFSFHISSRSQERWSILHYLLSSRFFLLPLPLNRQHMQLPHHSAGRKFILLVENEEFLVRWMDRVNDMRCCCCCCYYCVYYLNTTWKNHTERAAEEKDEENGRHKDTQRTANIHCFVSLYFFANFYFVFNTNHTKSLNSVLSTIASHWLHWSVIAIDVVGLFRNDL